MVVLIVVLPFRCLRRGPSDDQCEATLEPTCVFLHASATASAGITQLVGCCHARWQLSVNPEPHFGCRPIQSLEGFDTTRSVEDVPVR